jgi:hypothetical protein
MEKKLALKFKQINIYCKFENINNLKINKKRNLSK